MTSSQYIKYPGKKVVNFQKSQVVYCISVARMHFLLVGVAVMKAHSRKMFCLSFPSLKGI